MMKAKVILLICVVGILCSTVFGVIDLWHKREPNQQISEYKYKPVGFDPVPHDKLVIDMAVDANYCWYITLRESDMQEMNDDELMRLLLLINYIDNHEGPNNVSKYLARRLLPVHLDHLCRSPFMIR